MTVHAWLFDADGLDTEIDLAAADPPKANDRSLLWVDLDGRSRPEIEMVARRLGLAEQMIEPLMHVEDRPRLVLYQDHLHLSIGALVEPSEEGARASTEVARQELDIVAGQGRVVTIHDGPMAAIDRLLDGLKGETRLGALDAADLVASIVDSVILGYFRMVASLEQEIDRLDVLALRHRRADDVLEKLVDLRRRIGLVRRILASQREAFAPLARPDMILYEELGKPWPTLLDRLERAIDAVENLRDSLLGTYDIHMGREAQHANGVMKALTVLSAVLLPSIVLAGLMGMNFQLGFFESASNFWIVLVAMAGLAVTILGVAKARGWL